MRAYSLSGAVWMRFAEVLERGNDHWQTQPTNENIEDAGHVA